MNRPTFIENDGDSVLEIMVRFLVKARDMRPSEVRTMLLNDNTTLTIQEVSDLIADNF